MKFDDNSLYNIKSSLRGERYSLFDLAVWKNGLAFKKIHFSETGVPVIKIAELNNGIGATTAYTHQLFSDDVHLHKGDLLFSWSGNPQTSIDIFRFKLDEGWLNQHIFKVTPNESLVDRDYFYFFMKNLKPHFTQIATNKQTTGLGHVTIADVKRMSVVIPSLDMQRKIVSYIKPIDDKIELNNEINNNLEQQAVLLFKKWFIEFDNSSKNMLETRFGLVPESFKLLKNGELPLVVTDYVANGSFASLKANVTLYQEPNYAYFMRNTDLKSGTFEVFVDEHSYNFLSKSTLYGGEIIISNVGDVGSVFLCPKLDKPMTLGNNIIMLRPEQENLRYYLYIWFKWLYGQSLIQGIKGGSAQPKFNKTDFKNLPIFLPPDDLLEQFHQIVKPMFELINENNTENQALTRTRDTILPRLMSGELDVSDIEI